MSDRYKEIIDVIDFFQKTISIILALAITESFKEFINQHKEEKVDRLFHGDRVPSLISFLLLSVSFFEGISRHFYITYHAELNASYRNYIAIDSFVFLVEAAFFVAMSRSLPAARWTVFYKTVAGLLIVDLVWFAFRVLSGAKLPNEWAGFDLSLLVPIILIFLIKRKYPSKKSDIIFSSLLAFLVFGISVFWYWNSVDFYFPPFW